VQRFELGDVAIHWDATSGRGFTVGVDADPRVVRLRTERLGLEADRTEWIPHRSRRVLALPDEGLLWVPCPAQHTAGGFAYRAIPADLELWNAVNESRTVAQIGDRLGRPAADVLNALAVWGRFDTQAVQLWPQRVPAARLRRLEAPPRRAHTRTSDQYAEDGTTTLGAYHDAIADAATHFDDRETTVAHALALGHPGLQGDRFGARLKQVLRAEGFDVEGDVVEVGCGTGELAEAWSAGARYTRIDRSPTLLAAQQERVPDSPGVHGDARDLPLPDASVDVVLSNEVLADLPSTPTETGWDNVGAREMVAEVARVLRPGGRAYLSEFGVVDGEAEEARQLDHPEVSIQFGPLARFASSLGLQARIVRMDDLLGVDLSASQLSRHSWQALRALARSRDLHLEARAWTDATLRLPWRVDGLEWTTLADEGPGPLVTRFWALLLRKE
jgi:SAM-dependent methyltransferase